jgi:hypothetical protein
MIRILPCQNCGHARLQNGDPYWLTRFPEIGAQRYFVYECHGCRGQRGQWKPQSVTLHEFNALPVASGVQLVALGISGQVLRDLMAGGKMTADGAIKEYDRRAGIGVQGGER